MAYDYGKQKFVEDKQNDRDAERLEHFTEVSKLRADLAALRAQLAASQAECERLRGVLKGQYEFYCDWYDNGKHSDASNTVYEIISHARAALAAADGKVKP